MNLFENVETAVIKPITLREIAKAKYRDYIARRDALLAKLVKAKTERRKAKIRAELEQLKHEYEGDYEIREEVK